MNTLPQTRSEMPSTGYSAQAEMTVELAKMLALVAPTSMSADQQEMWLRAAVDALDGIRPTDVRNVSHEIRRSVTRPSQIVPEITRLITERGKPRNITKRTAEEWLELARESGDPEKIKAWEQAVVNGWAA